MMAACLMGIFEFPATRREFLGLVKGLGVLSLLLQLLKSQALVG
jgi:hypothetical protein